MKVEILLFASLRDELGAACVLDVAETAPQETSVAHVREAFRGVSVSAARLGNRVLVAVNERHAADTDPVRSGDTVAFLPPLAGG